MYVYIIFDQATLLLNNPSEILNTNQNLVKMCSKLEGTYICLCNIYTYKQYEVIKSRNITALQVVNKYTWKISLQRN